jgi:hypothetical protein
LVPGTLIEAELKNKCLLQGTRVCKKLNSATSSSGIHHSPQEDKYEHFRSLFPIWELLELAFGFWRCSMVAAVALQSQTQPKNEQFYKLTLEALRQDYKAKILNAETYLYYLIKAKNATGWRWRFNVKEFCAEWQIPERSFYRALSKLRAKNLIFWRPGDNTIILWWDKEVTKIANVYSNDSANRPTQTQ